MVFVGFSTPRLWNPLSALIRAMTHSRTSHAWLLVEDPAFKLRLVLEAHSSGFRLVSFTRFVKDNVVVALVEPSHPVEPGLPAAGEWLGESFDVLGLFGIFLTLLGALVPPAALAEPVPDRERALLLGGGDPDAAGGGIPGERRRSTPEATTPAELLAFFERDPACVVHEREGAPALAPPRDARAPEGFGAPPPTPQADVPPSAAPPAAAA